VATTFSKPVPDQKKGIGGKEGINDNHLQKVKTKSPFRPPQERFDSEKTHRYPAV